MIERTLAIFKPDCVEKKLEGKVLTSIQDAGFTVVAMQSVRLTKETAGGFYAVHRQRPFFESLLSYMSSGKCIAIVLEKENAVADFRPLIGATDPAQAAQGTIRRQFAESKERNIVHGSDSPGNAEIEINYFFSQRELVALSCK